MFNTPIKGMETGTGRYRYYSIQWLAVQFLLNSNCIYVIQILYINAINYASIHVPLDSKAPVGVFGGMDRAAQKGRSDAHLYYHI